MFVNRTGRYEHLSYVFDNRSADMLRAGSPGPAVSPGGERGPAGSSVRIYRRARVAPMGEHVGTKA